MASAHSIGFFVRKAVTKSFRWDEHLSMDKSRDRAYSGPPTEPGGSFSQVEGDTQDTTAPEDAPSGASKRTLGSGRVRIGAVVAIAVAGGLLGWLLTRGGNDSSSAPTTQSIRAGQTLPGFPPGAHIGPTIGSKETLALMQRALHQPVYWLGPQTGNRVEFEKFGNGNVYLTYLPAGVSSSGDRTKYLVVGTYPVRKATTGLKAVAKAVGGEILDRKDGAIVLITPKHPKSAYIAYPKADYEVEIYSPKAQEARTLAQSDKLQLVG